MLRRVSALLSALLAAFALFGADAASSGDPTAGQFLVASEQMGDPRFAGTVILMVEHDETGALGLVVNRPLGALRWAEVLEGLIDPDAAAPDGSILVHYGGPVSPEQGFVVHGPDYALDATSPVTDAVSVTSDPQVLEDIAAGSGPAESLFVIGYAGWGPGQLEGELARHDWITVPVDADLLFRGDPASMWGRAMDLQGIDL